MGGIYDNTNWKWMIPQAQAPTSTPLDPSVIEPILAELAKAGMVDPGTGKITLPGDTPVRSDSAQQTAQKQGILGKIGGALSNPKILSALAQAGLAGFGGYKGGAIASGMQAQRQRQEDIDQKNQALSMQRMIEIIKMQNEAAQKAADRAAQDARQDKQIKSTEGIAASNRENTAGIATATQQAITDRMGLVEVTLPDGTKAKVPAATIYEQTQVGNRQTANQEFQGKENQKNRENQKTLANIGLQRGFEPQYDKEGKLLGWMNPATKESVRAPEEFSNANKGGSKSGSSAADKNRENAASGLRAIADIKQFMKDDSWALWKSAVPGSPGARKLATAKREVQDVLTRLRTGAALNESEEIFYANQLPTVGDSQDTINYKLSLIEKMFSGLSGGGSAQPQSGEGGAKTADEYLKNITKGKP